MALTSRCTRFFARVHTFVWALPGADVLTCFDHSVEVQLVTVLYPSNTFQSGGPYLFQLALDGVLVGTNDGL
jgi:hypothetical protein